MIVVEIDDPRLKVEFDFKEDKSRVFLYMKTIAVTEQNNEVLCLEMNTDTYNELFIS